METNLTLSEVKKIIKEGDRVQTEHDNHLPSNNFTCINGKLFNVHGNKAGFSYEMAARTDWQIIPAKKEVMTVEEAWDKYAGSYEKAHPNQGRGKFFAGFGIGAENAHLLYADLVEAAGRLAKGEYIDERRRNVDKLKIELEKLNATAPG